VTPAGLYVHVPFCLTRCGYCDFNAYAGLGHLADRYADALGGEARLLSPSWEEEHIETVFFGGGTPTTLDPAVLVSLVDMLRDRFDVAADAEVTVEANPDTVDEGSLAVLREGGFTRLSMGAQSFDPVVLEALERVHQPEAVRRAFAAARAAGFTNVNVDLIFGADGETMASWSRTLEEALALEPDHLSCYALTVEPATPLGHSVRAGLTPAPDPDGQADMYEEACRVLGGAGYDHYEVSNWARAGFECRHNLLYWRRGSYLGIGAGAHSHRDGRRWWNLRPPAAYIEALERGAEPIAGEEHLTPAESRLEDVFLRLRTSRGIARDHVEDAAAAPFLEQGLLVPWDGRYVLSERGMFLANDIALALAG
jgi:putative oxygen-independent coproporphyrinogen III oxidase